MSGMLRRFGRGRNADPQARRLGAAALLCFGLFLALPLAWLEVKARTTGKLGEPAAPPRPEYRDLRPFLPATLPEPAHRLRLVNRVALPTVHAMTFAPAMSDHGTPVLALLTGDAIVLLDDRGTSQTLALPVYTPPERPATEPPPPPAAEQGTVDSAAAAPSPFSPPSGSRPLGALPPLWPVGPDSPFEAFRTADGRLHFVTKLDDPVEVVRFSPDVGGLAVRRSEAVFSPPRTSGLQYPPDPASVAYTAVSEAVLRVFDDGAGNPLVVLHDDNAYSMTGRSGFQIRDAELNLLWAPAEGESFPEPAVFAWGPVSDPEQGAGLVLATTAMNLPSGMRRHFVPLGDPSAMREMPGTKAVLANLPVHPNSTLSAPSAAIGVIKTAWLQSNSGEIEVAHAEGVVARPAPNRRQSVIAFMHSDLFLSPAPGNNWAMPFEVVDDLGRRVANLWTTKSGLMQYETFMGGEGDEQVPTIRLSYGGRTLGWNGEVHGLETPEGDPARRLFDGAVQIEDAEVFVLPDGMLLGIETGAAAGRQVLLYRLEPAGEAAR